MEPTVTIEEIGPEQAAEILEHNDHNRRTDARVIDNYARQMIEGEWAFAGDPIRISVTGRLLDGQYRLKAIEQSETTQRFTVVRGLPNETQPYMDVGKRRSPGDVFSMYGIVAPGPVAAVTQLLMRYESGMVLEQKHSITAAEALAFYEKPENTQLITEGTRLGLSMKRLVPLNPSVTGVVYVAARRHTDLYTANAFFEQVTHGLGLKEGDAIAALRSWLMRRQRENLKVNRAEYLWVATRVWNAWATNEPMYRVQLPKSGLTSKDKIPQLIAAEPLEPPAVSEDNPAVTPYNHTRAEREARNGGKRAS